MPDAARALMRDDESGNSGARVTSLTDEARFSAP